MRGFGWELRESRKLPWGGFFVVGSYAAVFAKKYWRNKKHPAPGMLMRKSVYESHTAAADTKIVTIKKIAASALVIL